MLDEDFIIVKDIYGWKVINNSKFKSMSLEFDVNDPEIYKKIWRKCHTHLKSHNMALVIVDCIKHSRMPKTRSERVLKSIIRISSDLDYISKIEKLIAIRKRKGRQEYLIQRREQSYYKVKK